MNKETSTSKFRRRDKMRVTALRLRISAPAHPNMTGARNSWSHVDTRNQELGTRLGNSPDPPRTRMNHSGDMFTRSPLSAASVLGGHRDIRIGEYSPAARLSREDDTEEEHMPSAHERSTCPVHRRWSHQGVFPPAHAIRATGHRWCRSCDAAIIIAIDEFTDTAADRQVLQSCWSSLLAWQDRNHPGKFPRRRQAA
jgi:hypothetical protein